MEKKEISNMSHMEFVLSTFKMMQSNGIKLVYEGEINQSLTKVLAALTEKKLEDVNEDVNITRKVYHVMIECLQNICKHSAPNQTDESFPLTDGIFMISEEPNNYSVTTGNVISNEKVEKMKEILNSINSLTKEEVKAAFMKQMREGSLSEKGGAGLGFLDIAKKTGNKFQYHVEQINDENCFFVLKTEISKI